MEMFWIDMYLNREIAYLQKLQYVKRFRNAWTMRHILKWAGME